jgi:prevent-host-death family protein
LTCSRPSGYMCSYMRPTAKVTVRELKNQTTAILRRVEGGEAVAVTRRGQVIATIGPASGPPPMASDSIYRQLQRQIETRRPGPVSEIARRAEFERISRKAARSLPYRSWREMDRAAKGDRFGLSR